MMRFNFKRIASAAASAAMLGSTVALAAAASWPGDYADANDVTVAYGNSLDLGSVTDITSALSAAIADDAPSTGVPTGGDFVQLDKSNDRVNLGDAINSGIGTTVDDDDLSSLLADGTYTADDKDDFDFEQKITLPSVAFSHFRDSDYEDLIGVSERTPVLGFKLTSDSFVLNYTLDFLDDAESTNSSGDLTDLEGSDLPLFGKMFYVSDAKANGANFGTWTLLDSANTATISEGETITVTAGGKTYDVSISFVSGTETRLSINGELTDSLTEGQTEKLSDGSYVGIREVTKLEVAGEIGSVEFSIGSGKLELTHGNDIELNDDAINDVKAYLNQGTNSGTTAKVDSIVIEWKADDDMFLTPETELEMPGFGGVKFTMNDVVRLEEETITLQNDGDDSIELRVPVKDGIADFNLLYAASSGNFSGIGKAADERLATTSGSELIYYEKFSSADYHKYAVVSYNTTDDSESYLLSFEINEDSSDGRNETTIKNEVTGETWSERTAGDTFDIGDVSFTINDVSKTSTQEFVNITAGTNVNFNTIFSEGGLKFYLPFESTNESTSNGAINFTAPETPAGHNVDTFYLFAHGEDKDDNLASGTEFNFTLNNNADGDLQVSQVSGEGTGGPDGLERGDSNTYESYVKDATAPLIVHYTDPDQDWAEVYYAVSGAEEGESQVYAEAFLSETGTSSSSGDSVDLGNVAVMDDEVTAGSGHETKNIIAVGGSCVNSVTAEILGVAPSTCGADWTTATGVDAGEWLIQVSENPWASSKIATVVAGYEQGDTVNAATALRTQANIELKAGNAYTGTTGSSADAVVEEA